VCELFIGLEFLSDDTQFNIVHLLSIKIDVTCCNVVVACGNLLNRIEPVVPSTNFAMLNGIYFNVQHYIIPRCSTFVEQQLQHLLLNKC